MIVTPNEIIDFWFSSENRGLHFQKDKKFDDLIKSRFYKTWEAGRSGELFLWRRTLEGRAAEIIVLDQFSRNMFRNSKAAFSQDGLALVLAQEAIIQKGFWDLSMDLKTSILMPFMHSESRLIHEEAVVLFKKLGDCKKLFYEEKHKEIIDKFGRYPHRNDILKRISTVDEVLYLRDRQLDF